MHRLLIKVKLNMRMIFRDFLFRIPRLLLTVVQILRFQPWLPKRLSNNSFGQVGPLCILVDFDHLKLPVKLSGFDSI